MAIFVGILGVFGLGAIACLFWVKIRGKFSVGIVGAHPDKPSDEEVRIVRNLGILLLAVCVIGACVLLWRDKSDDSTDAAERSESSSSASTGPSNSSPSSVSPSPSPSESEDLSQSSSSPPTEPNPSPTDVPAKSAATYLSEMDILDDSATDQYPDRLEVDGTKFENGIRMHRTECVPGVVQRYGEFSLSRKYNRLVGTVGPSDTNSTTGIEIRVKVYGDRRILLNRVLREGDTPIKLDVPVANVLRLRLEGTFVKGEDCSTGDLLIWGEAAVS